VICVGAGKMVYVGVAQWFTEYAGGGAIVVFNGSGISTDCKGQDLEITADFGVELLATHRNHIVSCLLNFCLILDCATIQGSVQMVQSCGYGIFNQPILR